jgi:hypothetical protein
MTGPLAHLDYHVLTGFLAGAFVVTGSVAVVGGLSQ